MALATVALAGNGINAYPQRAGILPVTVTLSATAYATASGGVLVDISALITQFAGSASSTQPVPQQANAFFWTDVIGGWGIYVDATPLGKPIAVTKTSTSGQFTVRVFGGVAGAEVADSNLTATITLWVLLDPGSRSYNAAS